MKPILAILTTLLIMPLALAQPGSFRLITNPTPPRKEILDRLALVQAWHVKLDTDRLRDGLASVQILYHPRHPQIAVQTVSGKLYLLDGETGETIWKQQLGVPYYSMQPVGYNSHTIFATRRGQLYVLDRKTGNHRVSSTEGLLKTPTFGMPLPSVPSGAPAADEDAAFFPLGDRIVAMLFPDYPLIELSKGIGKDAEKGKNPDQVIYGDNVVDVEGGRLAEPRILWIYQIEGSTINASPIVAGDRLATVTAAGEFIVLNKYQRLVVNDFKARGRVRGGLGQYGTVAYMGSDDFGIYAIDTDGGQVEWRFLAGGSVVQQPSATNRDVFVVGEKIGLYRIDRVGGQSVWVNRTAQQYLSNNHRFAYVLDRVGHLMVLDYERGTALGQYDVRDWQVPVSNEWNDRIYLANHDGQVLCLRYRDNPQPFVNKSPAEKKKIQPKAPPMVEPKEEPKVDPDKMGFSVPFSRDAIAERGRVPVRVTSLRYRVAAKRDDCGPVQL